MAVEGPKTLRNHHENDRLFRLHRAGLIESNFPCYQLQEPNSKARRASLGSSRRVENLRRLLQFVYSLGVIRITNRNNILYRYNVAYGPNYPVVRIASGDYRL